MLKSESNTLKILAVITARGGSKGIPGKNIKLLGGKPLIAYTIETAKQSRLLTHTILSTDDEKIINVAKEYGIEMPFVRPKELAQDMTPHLPVIQHAIKFMEEKLGYQFNYVVILQPTSPFRTVEDLDETINLLIETGADSAVSVVEMKDNHPIKAKKLDGNQVLPYCIPEPEGIRRQDLPPAYKRSGAVYAMRRDLVMNDNRLYGDNIVGYEVPLERSIDIDVPLDWLQAEYMLDRLKKRPSDCSAGVDRD
ncbi:MAG: acylneuraminate cytidylyltransferase family protein [Patescibacteria group bacterium]